MVYKVLSIVIWVLLPFVLFAGGACLVYTVASPIVQEKIDGIGSGVRDLVQQATDAISVGAGDGLPSGVGGFIDGLLGTSGIDTSDIAGAYQQMTQMGGGTATSADQFADASQGQAYLTWRSTIQNPLDRVLAGTGVDATLLEGVAGGSSSASEMLASLDDATLDAISANASSYSRAVTQLAMPSNMPTDAQAYMSQARTSALNFAAQVQTLVSGVRSLKGGNVFALGDLSDSAGGANASLSQLDANLRSAEAVLGVG